MNTMTFTAWVKGSSTSSGQRIFDFGNGEDEYLYLTPTNGSAMRFEIKKDDEIQGLNATTTLGTGTWKHVAVTIGTDKVKIYINGTEYASDTNISLRPSDIAPTICMLGRSQSDGGSRFKGLMSDIRLYNYELTGSEIQALANITSNTGGYDVTAERIPNIADNVSNWATTGGKWDTWTSTTEDANNLTSPYVRTTGTGTSTLTKALTYMPEGTYKLDANCYAFYDSYRSRNYQQLFLNTKTLTLNSARNRTATLRTLTADVTSNNTLEFGIRTTSASCATNIAMDNVKLVFQGSSAEYIEGIELITYNRTANAEELVNKRMNAGIRNALRTALNNISTPLNNYTAKIASGTATPNDVDPWIAAMDALLTTDAENKSSLFNVWKSTTGVTFDFSEGTVNITLSDGTSISPAFTNNKGWISIPEDIEMCWLKQGSNYNLYYPVFVTERETVEAAGKSLATDSIDLVSSKFLLVR
jgi:hypothetical protein